MKEVDENQVNENELEKLYGGTESSQTNDKQDRVGCDCHASCKLNRGYSDDDDENVLF